eukprot:358811-Chlamydomonas_euryale.AAC.17
MCKSTCHVNDAPAGGGRDVVTFGLPPGLVLCCSGSKPLRDQSNADAKRQDSGQVVVVRGCKMRGGKARKSAITCGNGRRSPGRGHHAQPAVIPDC